MHVKQYYFRLAIVYWIILSLLFTLKSYSYHQNLTFDDLVMSQGFSITLTIFICAFLYYYNTKWGPNKRNKSYKKPPFKALKANGFTEENHYFIGTIHRYKVICQYLWEGLKNPNKPSILISVLYQPKVKHNKINKEELERLETKYKKDNLHWESSHVNFEFSYRFKKPNHLEIMTKTKAMIHILEQEGLRPITREEHKKWIEKLNLQTLD